MATPSTEVGEPDLHAARMGVLGAARRYDVRLQPEDIEDLMQDTMVRILGRVSEPLTHRNAYIGRAAQNVLVGALRRKTAAKRDERVTVSLDDAERSHSAGSLESRYLLREELEVFLAACRRALSERQLRVFLLSCFLGFTGAEIAEACGISTSCAHTRLYRARGRLVAAGIPVASGGSLVA